MDKMEHQSCSIRTTARCSTPDITSVLSSNRQWRCKSRCSSNSFRWRNKAFTKTPRMVSKQPVKTQPPWAEEPLKSPLNQEVWMCIRLRDIHLIIKVTTHLVAILSSLIRARTPSTSRTCRTNNSNRTSIQHSRWVSHTLSPRTTWQALPTRLTRRTATCSGKVYSRMAISRRWTRTLVAPCTQAITITQTHLFKLMVA